MVSIKTLGLGVMVITTIFLLLILLVVGLMLPKILDPEIPSTVDFSQDIFIHLDADNNSILTIDDYRIFYYTTRPCKITKGQNTIAFTSKGACGHTGDVVLVEVNRLGLGEHLPFKIELKDEGKCQEQRIKKEAECVWTYI